VKEPSHETHQSKHENKIFKGLFLNVLNARSEDAFQQNRSMKKLYS
jgi:hypothetical protein